MKKILMVRLDAMVVVGFTACNNNGNGPAVVEDATEYVEVLTTGTLGSKNVSDLIETGATIAADGKVTAVLKSATGFEDFNSTEPAEQSGFYLPIKFKGDVVADTPFTVVGSDKGEMKVDTDLTHVFRVGGTDLEETALQAKSYDIDIQLKDGIVRVHLDLSGCTIADGE